jgi:hypothetical protein
MLILKWARHWREKVLSRLQSFEAVGSFAFAPRQIRALLLSPHNWILVLRIVGRRFSTPRCVSLGCSCAAVMRQNIWDFSSVC